MRGVGVAGGYVYVARDVEGRVLYVGVTGDMKVRLAAHRRTSRWWPLHASIDVDEFETIEAAAAAENERICAYDPPFNIRGGHGCAKRACTDRRCERIRAENASLEASRRRRLLNQPRHRCAPPLREWYALRAAAEGTGAAYEQASGVSASADAQTGPAATAATTETGAGAERGNAPETGAGAERGSAAEVGTETQAPPAGVGATTVIASSGPCRITPAGSTLAACASSWLSEATP